MTLTSLSLRVVALVFGLSQGASAQARVVSAPSEPSLLNLTSGWARASTLGILSDLRVKSDYLELRVWRGYAQDETQGIVLRRADGHWSAFLARVIRCEIQVAAAIADTATSTTMRRFVADARRNCGQSLVDVMAGARIITADTLEVRRLDVSESEIEAAWTEAQNAGVLQLPARVDHRGASGDGTTFVIELRRGDEYRAAEIPEVEQPETPADSQVKRIYTAVLRLRP